VLWLVSQLIVVVLEVLILFLSVSLEVKLFGDRGVIVYKETVAVYVKAVYTTVKLE
jgi:hypothetical protein